jgi:hypothetical protein
MWIRIQIAAMVYLMVQAVMFGVGVVLVLTTPLADMAMTLMPWVVATTAVLWISVSWMIAPRLQERYWREKGLALLWQIFERLGGFGIPKMGFA